MASHDVRDVLNLPQDGTAGPRPAKKQKTSAPRPNLKGLAREVQNLGGDNPIAIVPEVSVFKKRRFASRKPAARWEFQEFSNSARNDGSLILRHWRRKTDAVETDRPPTQTDNDDTQMADAGAEGTDARPRMEDSAFAKLNVQVDVPQYSETQYDSNLQNDDWTKEETDYLLGLVRDFDLRWPLIWDRYEYAPRAEGDGTMDGDDTAVIPAPKQRSMEDLKKRYYEVAAKMMEVQKPRAYMTGNEFRLHEVMLNFDPRQEQMRKQFALNSLARSKEEAREEESLLLEIKRILARMDRFNEERRELAQRLDYPRAEQDVGAFKSSAGLQNLLQNLMNVDKSKKRKSLMGPEGATPGSAAPNGTPVSAAAETPTVATRRESVVANTTAAAPGHRDSVGASEKPPPPEKNNKKGQQHQEHRKLTEQEEQVYGVSHHDRLSTGPTFRYEKVNKLFTHKSGQQQLRITNVMNELDIPPRLVMPTAAVTAQFEQLVLAVTTLVDQRKVHDKLEAEIKIEEAKKAEREKAKGAAGGQADGAGGDETEKNDTSKEGQEAAPGSGKGTAGSAGSAAGAEAPNGEAEVPDKDRPQDEDTGDGAGAGDKARPETAEPTTDGDAAVAAPDVEIKEEDVEKEKEKSARPGSSGVHKRSASVLSTISDKSAKRQKK